MSSQFIQENAVGKFQSLYYSPDGLLHRFFPSSTNRHLAIEADLADQAGPVFHESMWPRPDPLVVLHVPCDATEDDLFLPQNRKKRKAQMRVYNVVFSLFSCQY